MAAVTTSPLILACLGHELTDLRVARGWTRGRVATLLLRDHGVELTVRTIASYEHAQRVMPVLRLLELCEVYEVPASTVLAAAYRRAEQDDCCPTCRRPS